MQIFEIFRSIQGETSRVGVPMWFIRLAGCDLACSYCDTAAARDPAAGRRMTVAEVLAAVDAPALPWAAITGGEPMLQTADVNALIAALVDPQDAAWRPPGAGGPGDPPRGAPALLPPRRVLVETSGAHPVDALDPRAVRIIDWKTPGSGMAGRMCRRNLDLARSEDEVKFVLTGRPDYQWAREVVAREGLASRTTVLFGAAAPQLQPRQLAEWIMADGLPVRLNLQVHKFLGLR